MSQSPLNTSAASDNKAQLKEYLVNWGQLATKIRRGQSFSGRERNCVFLNTGGERWITASGISGLDGIDDARAVASTDWDHDGDLDLWFANRTGPRVRYFENNQKPGNRFLHLRLVDHQGNRDAIGARVTVYRTGNASALARTVRAGGGFVSQSSKWLHFGLGDSQVDRVEIAWPNGRTEILRGISHNGRYLVTRSSDIVASRVEKLSTRQGVAIGESPSRPRSHEATARTVLTRRRTMDLGEYSSPGKTALLVLWASWCPSCITELTELSEAYADFAGENLEIIPIQVDEFAASTGEESETQQSVLSDLSFESKAGSQQLLQMFAGIESEILYFQRPLTLPSSYLIDARGKLAVIYKGPLRVDQLHKDLELLKSDQAEMHQAFPFPGRSGLSLFPMTAADVARAYIEADYADTAEEELIRYLVETKRKLNNRTIRVTEQLKREMEDAYITLARLLFQQTRVEEASGVAKQGMKFFPNSSKLRELIQP